MISAGRSPLCAVVGALMSASAIAQAPAEPPGAAQGSPDKPPPQLVIGARAEAVRRNVPVLPVVVIVADAASYAEAIARWTIKGRFPVLIDDGSTRAREDIARFVRGFRIEREAEGGQRVRVVRWSIGAEEALSPPREGDGVIRTWPDVGAARRDAITLAVARAWGWHVGKDQASPTWAQIVEQWIRIGLRPPGVVLTHEDDPAWPAALALSAGRAQPIAFLSAAPAVQPGSILPLPQAEAIADAAERAAAGTGLSWQGLGDDLDAVTLALNTPVKFAAPPGSTAKDTDLLATTDRVGRRSDPGKSGPTALDLERWAWCGQIIGGPASASYTAMSSLFLVPRSAWVFDGYPENEPWNAFDGTEAARILQEAGIETAVDDTPRQSERDWRRRTARALGAERGTSLVLVNTKGNADFFEIGPPVANMRPGDVPVLSAPAAVYFVHSWSLTRPDDEATIAGRWLRHGVHAYIGSVHEPFLQAFIPTPAFAARFTAGAPWGVAGRIDQGPIWKIAVIGDPLMTVGPRTPAAPEDAKLPLAGAIDVRDEVPDLVKDNDFAAAMLRLTLAGDDEPAARLAAALLSDRPDAITSQIAARAVMPLFRTGRTDAALRMVRLLPSDPPPDPELIDAAWHSAQPRLAGIEAARPEGEPLTITQIVDILRVHARQDQLARDGMDLARAMARGSTTAAGLAVLESLRSRAQNENQRRQIEEAMSQFRAAQRR